MHRFKVMRGLVFVSVSGCVHLKMSVACRWGVDSLIASDKQDVCRGESVNELAVMD